MKREVASAFETIQGELAFLQVLERGKTRRFLEAMKTLEGVRKALDPNEDRYRSDEQ